MRIASSTASMTASNSGFIALLAIVRTSATSGASSPMRCMPRLPVANARKRSPLLFSPTPPVRATPNDARCASRRHCSGSSGASVATMPMIEPLPGGMGESVPGTTSSPTSSPTGTPLTRNRSRRPWLAWTSTPTVYAPGRA